MKPPIDAVVFDVGWVLVHLEFQPLLACMQAGGAQFAIAEMLAAIDLGAHERGEFGGEQLISNLHGLAPAANRETIKRAWLDMLLPNEAMWQLARSLLPRYRVYLLSNVGELHWLHLHNRYDLRSLAHDVLPSFEAGVMKPHADIYRQAEQRFGVTAANTVFIDDLEPNVEAARARGWQAIRHQSPAHTMQTLRELGVEW